MFDETKYSALNISIEILHMVKLKKKKKLVEKGKINGIMEQ